MEHFGHSLNYAFTVLVGLDLLVLVNAFVTLDLLEELGDNQIESLHLAVLRSAYVTTICVSALHEDVSVLLQEGHEAIREISWNLIFV